MMFLETRLIVVFQYGSKMDSIHNSIVFDMAVTIYKAIYRPIIVNATRITGFVLNDWCNRFHE